MFIIQKFLTRKRIRKKILELEKDHETDPDVDEIILSEEIVLRERSLTLHELSGINTEIPALLHSVNLNERKALQRTWSHMTKKDGFRKVTNLMLKVFQNTLKKEPKAKLLFIKAAFAHGVKDATQKSDVSTIFDHSRQLAQLLDAIIEPKQGKLQVLGPTVIAQIHAPLFNAGLTADVWESFGTSFSKIMTQEDVVRALPYAARAWNILIAVLTDRIRAAFDKELKLKRMKKARVPGSSKSLDSNSFSNCQTYDSSFQPVADAEDQNDLVVNGINAEKPQLRRQHNSSCSGIPQPVPVLQHKQSLLNVAPNETAKLLERRKSCFEARDSDMELFCLLLSPKISRSERDLSSAKDQYRVTPKPHQIQQLLSPEHNFWSEPSTPTVDDEKRTSSSIQMSVRPPSAENLWSPHNIRASFLCPPGACESYNDLTPSSKSLERRSSCFEARDSDSDLFSLLLSPFPKKKTNQEERSYEIFV